MMNNFLNLPNQGINGFKTQNSFRICATQIEPNPSPHLFLSCFITGHALFLLPSYIPHDSKNSRVWLLYHKQRKVQIFSCEISAKNGNYLIGCIKLYNGRDGPAYSQSYCAKKKRHRTQMVPCRKTPSGTA